MGPMLEGRKRQRDRGRDSGAAPAHSAGRTTPCIRNVKKRDRGRAAAADTSMADQTSRNQEGEGG